MSRRNRSNVEQGGRDSNVADKIKAINNMSPQMNDLLDKVRELNESDAEQKPAKPASRSIKELILFGRVSRTVQMGDYSFFMTTLNNKEQKRLVRSLTDLEQSDRLLNVKTYTLSFVVKSINETKLEDIYEYDDDEDDMTTEEVRRAVIDNLPYALVTELFEVYDEMAKESMDLVKPEKMGDEIKN